MLTTGRCLDQREASRSVDGLSGSKVSSTLIVPSARYILLLLLFFFFSYLFCAQTPNDKKAKMDNMVIQLEEADELPYMCVCLFVCF